MMGLPFGLVVESLVAVLLLLTIGYCMVLNERLKRLHADREALRQMVTDLVGATDMANSAIKGLKSAASEADTMLNARLEEADRFAVQLANHISSGQGVMERIAKITEAARKNTTLTPVQTEKNRASAALEKLREHQGRRGRAA